MRLLHGLAEHFGGDHNACDLARILRAPGSINHKYTPPRPAAVVQLNDFRYALDDLLEVVPKWTPPHNSGGSSNPSGWLLDALKGVSSGSRGKTGAKIAGYFVNRLPTDDLLTIMSAWNSHNNPPLSEREVEKIVRSVGRYKRIQHGTPKKRIEIFAK